VGEGGEPSKQACRYRLASGARITRRSRKGCSNLDQHIANVRAFGITPVVAINAFAEDSKEEMEEVRARAIQAGAAAAVVCTHWAEGGRGAEDLARAVVEACRQPSAYAPLYEDAASIKQKISTVATGLYGAKAVVYDQEADAQIEHATRLGYGSMPVCMAKSPLSLSHDSALKGRPKGFTLPVKQLKILAGAGFVTAVCSGVQLMPGLPSKPALERIEVDPLSGEIVGLS